MSGSLPSDQGESCVSSLRFRFVKIALWILLIPVVLFLLSNLWLGSSWGRGVAEDKLKKRTGMDWEVQSITWSPWNGVTIKKAVVLQPQELRAQMNEPLLTVAQINVKPYWTKLIRGKISASEVAIVSPQFTVAVEMLAALVADQGQRVMVPQPSKVTRQPKTTKSEELSKKQKPQKPKRNQLANNKNKPVTKEKKSPQRPPAQDPMRIMVKNASIRVISAAKGIDLVESSAMDLDVPISGEDAKGSIKIGELKVPGVPSVSGIEQELVWRRPYLEIEEQALELGGIHMRYSSQLGMLSGIPFLAQLVMEPQKIEHIDLLDRFALDVKSDRAAGRFNVIGSLVNPMSWRSSMIVMSDRLSVIERHGGHQLHFDEFSIPAIFQHGTLSWSSVRMIGEDISLLGNGRISPADGITSVTRVVAAPELAKELHGAMIGACLVRHRPWWKNLDTPDRKYRDVYITGPLSNPNIDLGAKHRDLSLWQTISAVLRFIRIEMKEEGVELKSVPNKNLLNPKYHANH